ncbi:hypothetical protein CPT_Stills21 [Bacillus phage Stills]|uniref:Uncharacterized protein n=1 Tax=Bacillus phage Stills TaxID=1610833 RepID=A0A0E3T6A0_9CAUD|nr:hypothetical protein CPT_Stills21 [Bacillus phage Stills]AKC02649.1 hypothetical protein CPT_Stills21 [Bacillus phage Stills]
MASRKKQGLDKKKLLAAMKRFIGTTQNDPEFTKYFKVENGIHYSATDMKKNNAIAAYIFLENIELWEKGTGVDYFAKPETGENIKTVSSIPGFPEVRGLFREGFLNGYNEVILNLDDLDDFIKLHEAMEKISKLSGKDFAAGFHVMDSEVCFWNVHSAVDFSYKYKTDVTFNADPKVHHFFYDPLVMVNIFKALKDLKTLTTLKMHIKDNKSPVFFTGNDHDYKVYMAIQRKIVRDGE